MTKKDDPIDKKLADFINSLNDPTRVKVMFIREGQGVYQFGTKKVYVKIDQEKIFRKFQKKMLFLLWNLE